MTLRTRLALGLAAITLLLTIPLALAVRALGDAQTAARQMREQDVAASLLLGRVRGVARDLAVADNAVVVLPDDPQSVPRMRAEIQALRHLADSAPAVGLDTLAGRLRTALRRLDSYGPVQWAAAADREMDLAERLSEGQIRPAIATIDTALIAGDALLAARATTRAREAEAASTDAQRTAAIVLGLAGLGVLGIAVWLTRSIARPVFALEHGMAAVAGGDFTHPLPRALDRTDEFGRLATSFRAMTAKLAELDRLKAEFVSIASHELKTPINVILGYVTLLADEIYGPVEPKQREVLRTVETQAQGLGRLVQHLLDVSRFQAGAGRLEVRPVALRPFLADVERAHGVLAMQQGIVLTVEVEPTVPEVAVWDADRMGEVLGNLLSNAFKFTPGGGQVRVHLAADDAEASHLRLEVRDTGAGIRDDELSHIFQRFFQADNQQAARVAGTGLGLAITKEIVEAHGGTIAVASTVGEGTCFTLRLPARADTTEPRGVPTVRDVRDGAAPDGAAPDGAAEPPVQPETAGTTDGPTASGPAPVHTPAPASPPPPPPADAVAGR